MPPKSPSSLDYEALLHELALKNWTAAMLAGDLRRAEQNARKLFESRDKLWRWVGGVKLALTELLRGSGEAAREWLRRSEGTYPEAPALGAIARRLAARLHLETGSPRLALEAIESIALPGKEDAYWRARCHARLGGSAAEDAASYVRRARGATDGPELAFARHVESELPEARTSPDRRAHLLEQALEAAPDDFDLSFPRSGIAIDVAASRLCRGLESGALELYRELAFGDPVRAQWPLAHVRALERYGSLCLARGEPAEAREALARYVTLWRDGDLDRSAVEDAEELVSS